LTSATSKSFVTIVHDHCTGRVRELVVRALHEHVDLVRLRAPVDRGDVGPAIVVQVARAQEAYVREARVAGRVGDRRTQRAARGLEHDADGVLHVDDDVVPPVAVQVGDGDRSLENISDGNGVTDRRRERPGRRLGEHVDRVVETLDRDEVGAPVSGDVADRDGIGAVGHGLRDVWLEQVGGRNPDGGERGGHGEKSEYERTAHGKNPLAQATTAGSGEEGYHGDGARSPRGHVSGTIVML
jgi:hypothetical protein